MSKENPAPGGCRGRAFGRIRRAAVDVLLDGAHSEAAPSLPARRGK